eukprot:7179847-Pyramimonas_sp.AAC.2
MFQIATGLQPKSIQKIATTHPSSGELNSGMLSISSKFERVLPLKAKSDAPPLRQRAVQASRAICRHPKVGFRPGAPRDLQIEELLVTISPLVKIPFLLDGLPHGLGVDLSSIVASRLVGLGGATAAGVGGPPPVAMLTTPFLDHVGQLLPREPGELFRET